MWIKKKKPCGKCVHSVEVVIDNQKTGYVECVYSPFVHLKKDNNPCRYFEERNETMCNL